MNQSREIWRNYYQKALQRSHLKRTEFAVKLNQSGVNVAVDCGCGTGSDIEYLQQQDYQVYGFDLNLDSVALCCERFASTANVSISHESFESFEYPKAGIILANSSLFFAESTQFEKTWASLSSSIVEGGVFCGDFLGPKDSWASNYHSATTPLSEKAVLELFDQYEVVRFSERDEKAKTALGKMKHWHTFSVVAVK